MSAAAAVPPLDVSVQASLYCPRKELRSCLRNRVPPVSRTFSGASASRDLGLCGDDENADTPHDHVKGGTSTARSTCSLTPIGGLLLIPGISNRQRLFEEGKKSGEGSPITEGRCAFMSVEFRRGGSEASTEADTLMHGGGKGTFDTRSMYESAPSGESLSSPSKPSAGPSLLLIPGLTPRQQLDSSPKAAEVEERREDTKRSKSSSLTTDLKLGSPSAASASASLPQNRGGRAQLMIPGLRDVSTLPSLKIEGIGRSSQKEDGEEDGSEDESGSQSESDDSPVSDIDRPPGRVRFATDDPQVFEYDAFDWFDPKEDGFRPLSPNHGFASNRTEDEFLGATDDDAMNNDSAAIPAMDAPSGPGGLFLPIGRGHSQVETSFAEEHPATPALSARNGRAGSPGGSATLLLPLPIPNRRCSGSGVELDPKNSASSIFASESTAYSKLNSLNADVATLDSGSGDGNSNASSSSELATALSSLGSSSTSRNSMQSVTAIDEGSAEIAASVQSSFSSSVSSTRRINFGRLRDDTPCGPLFGSGIALSPMSIPGSPTTLLENHYNSDVVKGQSHRSVTSMRSSISADDRLAALIRLSSLDEGGEGGAASGSRGRSRRGGSNDGARPCLGRSYAGSTPHSGSMYAEVCSDDETEDESKEGHHGFLTQGGQTSNSADAIHGDSDMAFDGEFSSLPDSDGAISEDSELFFTPMTRLHRGSNDASSRQGSSSHQPEKALASACRSFFKLNGQPHLGNTPQRLCVPRVSGKRAGCASPRGTGDDQSLKCDTDGAVEVFKTPRQLCSYSSLLTPSGKSRSEIPENLTLSLNGSDGALESRMLEAEHGTVESRGDESNLLACSCDAFVASSPARDLNEVAGSKLHVSSCDGSLPQSRDGSSSNRSRTSTEKSECSKFAQGNSHGAPGTSSFDLLRASSLNPFVGRIPLVSSHRSSPPVSLSSVSLPDPTSPTSSTSSRRLGSPCSRSSLEEAGGPTTGGLRESVVALLSSSS